MKINMYFVVSVALASVLLGFVFSDALIQMETTWQREEYSHGYLIPLISFWFVWENRNNLTALQGNPSWFGVIVVLLGLLLGLIGDLSTLYIITQYAVLLTLFGLILSFTGWRGMKILWFPLTYLIFMIPLPTFLYNNLSSQLQLISSQLGVAVIRAFDISVFLAGNVIDLGNFQLQVVEACSGLRYLFPLASFCFLCAYFFRAKLWMRILIFLSTLPITVFMNSFRIGVIGVLVENWGIEQAEGFLHDFEGWVIFIGCLGVLFIEMWLLVKFFYKGKNFSDVFVISALQVKQTEDLVSQPKKNMLLGLPITYWVSLLILLIATPISYEMGDRKEVIPERSRFTSFPLQFQGYRGEEIGMEQKYIDTLKFDDYIIVNYFLNKSSEPINFYAAYYASQRQGASAHSPKSCMPGDGWRMTDFGQYTVNDVKTADGSPLRVNRTVITKGDNKQLVYYWFQQRGRVITNEYLVKWYLFWDALTQRRTDGALVRLVVSLGDGVEASAGDKKLEPFLKIVYPQLSKYVPN